MADNPISVGKGGDYVPLRINKNDAITVSVTIKLLSTGWQYTASHDIVVAGKNVYSDDDEPVDFSLGNGSTLQNEKMGIRSQITQIKNGANADVPSSVLYTVVIKANGKPVQTFSKTSDTYNPVDFITHLQFV